MEEHENATIAAQNEEFQNREFNSEVSQTFMAKRRRNEDFDLDIVYHNIKLEKKTRIPTHKRVLIERCWYFMKMLNPQSNFKEAKESSIAFQCHNDLKIFKIFIDYLYSGIIELQGGNVFDIYSFSLYINQQELVGFSIQFLVNNLSCETLPQICAFADSNSISKLTADVQTWVDSNFNDVISKSTDVLKWPSNVLIQVLSSTKMKVKREETVLQVVCRWLNIAFDEREQFMQELFQKLRFSFMSTKDINAAFQEDEYKGMNSKIPIQCSISMTECNEKLSGSAPQYLPEEERDYYEGIYCCGERNGSKVFELHLLKNKSLSEKSLPHPSQKRIDPAMASLNDKLYLSGGFIMTDEVIGVFSNVVEMYDPLGNQWSPVASMNIERSGHINCACEQNIYVFGGLDKRLSLDVLHPGRQLDSEVYDPSTNRWSILPDHPFNIQMCDVEVWCTGATAVGTSIFVLYHSNEGARCLMEYKTKTNEWSELPLHEDYCGLIGYGCTLFLFALNRDVVIYDTNSKSFNRLQMDPNDLIDGIGFDVVVRYRDQIVLALTSGSGDPTFLYRFAVYDPKVALKTLEDGMCNQMPKIWRCEGMSSSVRYTSGLIYAVID